MRTNTVAFKTAFKNRYRSYRNLHRQRLAPHARLDVNLEPSPDGVARQVLAWTGAFEQCHGNTVGVGILEQETLLWPCGRGNGLCSVVYYEVEILDAGEHGFIAVGWAQRDFREAVQAAGMGPRDVRLPWRRWVRLFGIRLRPTIRTAIHHGTDRGHRARLSTRAAARRGLRRWRLLPQSAAADLLHRRWRADWHALWRQRRALLDRSRPPQADLRREEAAPVRPASTLVVSASVSTLAVTARLCSTPRRRAHRSPLPSTSPRTCNSSTFRPPSTVPSPLTVATLEEEALAKASRRARCQRSRPSCNCCHGRCMMSRSLPYSRQFRPIALSRRRTPKSSCAT